MLLVTSSRTSSIMAGKKFKMACGRVNLKSFSFILLKFVMHVTDQYLSDKFDHGWTKSQNG